MPHHTDWTTEDEYWQDNYQSRPYVEFGDYGYYKPAYRYGYDAAIRYRGRQWEDVELELERDWDSHGQRRQSTWLQMKDAVRDAWNHVTGGAQVGT
ncbi:MAG TPA: hypothetical protein VLD67_14760 [Vicinamibacterales bacterium]|nr:hypothetical protein [Vicinamibacterales bacterium]